MTALMRFRRSDFRSQRQRLSLLVSRRRAVSCYPREGAKKAMTFSGLQGPGQAVPTGEAHRLPKSVAYLSARPREVKTEEGRKCDGASTRAPSKGPLSLSPWLIMSRRANRTQIRRYSLAPTRHPLSPSAVSGYADTVPTPATTTRTSVLDDTPRIVCERCGQQFGCSRNRIADCWCVAEPYRLPIPLPPEAGNFGDCLCPTCLRAVAEVLAATANRQTPNDE